MTEQQDGTTMGAPLKLVSDNVSWRDASTTPFDRLLEKAEKLESLAAELEDQAGDMDSVDSRAGIEALAACSRTLADSIRRQIQQFQSSVR
jgi:hypothetical protein